MHCYQLDIFFCRTVIFTLGYTCPCLISFSDLIYVTTSYFSCQLLHIQKFCSFQNTYPSISGIKMLSETPSIIPLTFFLDLSTEQFCCSLGLCPYTGHYHSTLATHKRCLFLVHFLFRMQVFSILKNFQIIFDLIK